MIAVRAMFDMHTEMAADTSMKPKMIRFVLPLVILIIWAIMRLGNVDALKNVVKPKMPMNIHRAPLNVAAQMSLYFAIPKKTACTDHDQ